MSERSSSSSLVVLTGWNRDRGTAIAVAPENTSMAAPMAVSSWTTFGEAASVGAATATDFGSHLGFEQRGAHRGNAVRVVLDASAHDLFGLLAGALGALEVDLVRLLGRVGQDGHVVGLHLDEAAADGEIFLAAGGAHRYLAEVEHRQQRAMVG